MDGIKVIGNLRSLLRNFGRETTRGEGGPDERQLAAAALLVEVATVDTRFDDSERARIVAYVRERFGLSGPDAEALITAAQAAVDGSTQLYRFTSAVKNGFSYEERVALMESLWEVVYADGRADAFEDQLMRRIAGLICVTDRDRGQARKRALGRIGRQGP